MYAPNTLSQPLQGTEKIITTPDGSKIYTVEMGNGDQTIVLAHGYGITSSEWNVIAPMLVEKGYRVIAFDQKGHGQSTIGQQGLNSDTMSAVYAAVFEAYDLQQVVLVGHSMGGFLTMKALIGNEELQKRIKGCVLMATFAGEVNKKNFQNRLQLPLIRSGILLKLIGFKPIGWAFGRSLIGENPDDEVIRAFIVDFKAQNHKALVPIIQAFANESYYADLPKIKVPCTIVIGSQDKTTPPFHSDDLARLIPNATKIVLDKKGHALNWECPDKIVSIIEQLV